ncbi:MAG TPA: response regulator [Dermatophilaceae bacterium]|nr:response regulator [Dermatophilaceae bacterium]
MTRVLVVDDDPQILRALTINLEVRDYLVQTADTRRAALLAAARQPPDLVVLDLGLPDLDGVEVVHGLRGWSRVPIVVLSGRTDSADKVAALDAGADDYVTKPFEVEELCARLRAVVRRTEPGDGPGQPSLQLTAVVVDFGARTVTARTDGLPIRLTPTEWHILEVIARHPGRLVTQRQVLGEVWGPQYVKETGYLRVYLTQLRRKLEAEPSRPRHLITEAGMGYRLVL